MIADDALAQARAVDIRGGCVCGRGFPHPDEDLNWICISHLNIAAALRAYGALAPEVERLTKENGQLRDLIATGQSRGAAISPVVRDIFAAASRVGVERAALTATVAAKDALIGRLARALVGLYDFIQAAVDRQYLAPVALPDDATAEARALLAEPPA